MYVFPGGRVDSTDAEPSLVARSVLSPDETAAALGGDLAPAVALAAHLAAIRELFEEAGVLWPRRRRRRPPSQRAGPRSSAAARRLPTLHRTWISDYGRPARSALALGDPADPSAPVRCAVLRRGASGRYRAVVRGRRGGRPRVAPTGRRPGRDGRRAPRDVAADEHDPPAARACSVDRRDPARLAPGPLGEIEVEDLRPW